MALSRGPAKSAPKPAAKPITPRTLQGAISTGAISAPAAKAPAIMAVAQKAASMPIPHLTGLVPSQGGTGVVALSTSGAPTGGAPTGGAPTASPTGGAGAPTDMTAQVPQAAQAASGGGSGGGSSGGGGGDPGQPSDGSQDQGPPQDQGQGQASDDGTYQKMQDAYSQLYQQNQALQAQLQGGPQAQGGQGDGSSQGFVTDDDSEGEPQDESQGPQDQPQDQSQVNGEKPLSGASCYVQNGRLCCYAVVNTPLGAVPMTACIKLRNPAPDGPVQFGADVGVDNALNSAKEKLVSSGNIEALRKQAESLVTRARVGDQNAVATIEVVYEEAKVGNPKCRILHSLILQYCKDHPVTDENPVIGVETYNPTTYRNAVKLANGPPITRARIRDIVSGFAGANIRHRHVMHRAFMHGKTSFGEDAPLEALKGQLDRIECILADIAHSLGLAVGLQQVRRPGVPLRAFSKGVSNEFPASEGNQAAE